MLGNVKAVVRGWRKRCYFYASASVFDQVASEVKLWLEPVVVVDGEILENEREQQKRANALFKVQNYKGSFKLIGDTIVRFIFKKPNPFPSASNSKQHVLRIPAWKRAMIYINLVRYGTDIHANNHWYKFGYHNYKMNTYLHSR